MANKYCNYWNVDVSLYSWWLYFRPFQLSWSYFVKFITVSTFVFFRLKADTSTRIIYMVISSISTKTIQMFSLDITYFLNDLIIFVLPQFINCMHLLWYHINNLRYTYKQYPCSIMSLFIVFMDKYAISIMRHNSRYLKLYLFVLFIIYNEVPMFSFVKPKKKYITCWMKLKRQ